MTHQIHAVQHMHRRGLIVRRQGGLASLVSSVLVPVQTGKGPAKPSDTTSSQAGSTIFLSPSRTSTTTTTTSTSGSTTSTTTSTTSSTSVSTTSTSTTTSSTSLSSSTTSTPSTTTPPPSSSTVASVTTTASTTSSPQLGTIQTSVPSASKAISTSTLVGIIGGSVAGVVAVAIIVAFIVRHMRKKSLERDAFNATTFRRSAFLLDDPADPFIPDGSHHSHSGSHFSSDSGDGPGPGLSRNPRPPTMIERHLARAPTLPSTAYGADYNYARMQAPYATDAHYSQFTAEQYGRGGGAGVDGAAGAYGPYAAYAAQQQHPQYPQTQARYQQQQYGGQYALNRSMSTAPAPGRKQDLSNPFSSSVTTTAAAAVAAAHSAAAADVRSGSTSPPLARPSSQELQSGSSGPYLNRQPTQMQQQQQQVVYADIQRDEKAPRLPPLTVRNATPTSEGSVVSPDPDKKARDTVYDIQDAYGGM